MSKWKEVQLQDIVSILGDGLHGTPEYSPDGEYYFINGNNLYEGNIIFNNETKRVSYQEYLKYKKDLNHRTLFVSINGTIGNIAEYRGEKVILGKSACYFNVVDNVDKVFIKYVICNDYFKKYIQRYATGTTIKNVSLKTMREFSFKLPPLEEQKAIASVLSCLDGKIENLRKQNETLEAIAQTLFKHWFIDFEFPNEDGKPYKSSGGEMRSTPLGDIPKDWRVRNLKDLTLLITKGTTPTTLKKEFVNNGINFIKAESILDNHTLDKSKFAFIDEDTNILLKRSIVKEKDILYTIAGTIGRYAMISASNLPANTNQAVAIIRADYNKIDPEYLLCYFSSTSYSHYLSSRVVQAVQANLSLGVLGESPVINPSNQIRNNFYKIIQPIFAKKELNQEKIQTLTKTRDELLPKLMSGQIRVKE